ncbi:MAG: hypothetical protein R2875_06795 [Desulfobacterales bacterium]
MLLKLQQQEPVTLNTPTGVTASDGTGYVDKIRVEPGILRAGWLDYDVYRTDSCCDKIKIGTSARHRMMMLMSNTGKIFIG